MRRVLVPVAIVLALLSGAVLEATRHVVLSPALTWAGQPRARLGAGLVGRFYAAVNATIATGDDGALAELLSVDFVDHAPRPGRTPDRAGLLATVRSLHAVAPTRRLVVLDLVAEGDRVATRVGVEGAGEAVFLGLPVAADRLWGATDAFRIVAGRVAEHWGDTAGGLALTPLLAVDVAVSPPARKAVTLERWTYAPGAAETRVTNTGFLVVFVESGALRVVFDPSSRSPARLVPRLLPGAPPGTPTGDRLVSPGEPVTLQPGDALVVPRLDRFRVRNDGPMPASALAVVAEQEQPSRPLAGADAAPAIAHAVLAGGIAENLPPGEATVAIGQAAVSIGSPLPGHRVEIAEAAWVDAEALVLSAEGETLITEGVFGDAPHTLLVVTVGAVSGTADDESG